MQHLTRIATAVLGPTLLAPTLLVWVIAAPTLAQAPKGALTESCFDVAHHEGVVALDDRTLLVRAGSSVYRVELANSCPGLTRPIPRITFLPRGSQLVCGRLDYSIQVGENGLPGVPCTVASQRRLTPAEVAALPRGRRP